MTSASPRQVLLINPTITSRRSARFPLAVLNLSASLDGRYATSIIDGNIDRDFVSTVLNRLSSQAIDAIGVSVMGGPQLVTAIALSQAVRARFPSIPIIWGGYFPTISAEASLREPYVDYAIRGQGEATLCELLDAHFDRDTAGLQNIGGLSWRSEDAIIHNPNRPFAPSGLARELPYERLGDPRQYLGRTYLGQRTAAYQAALGCRFRCTFCGVATMFRGRTSLPAPERLEHDLKYLTTRLNADSLLVYDHNFFDREEDMLPLLEVLAKYKLPWWCYARSDALVNLSERAWALVRKSRLRMAYIGAESPSDWMLHDIRKGTRTNQTLEAIKTCERNGVIPELSFMLAPPHDPEGETEKTFAYIRQIKRVHPRSEIMLYMYAPLPPAPGARSPHTERAVSVLRTASGAPLEFPTTATQWAQPQWLKYWCHADTPWMTPRLRQRIQDFTTVLGCRFPTMTDVRTSRWSKTALQALASWRYSLQRYQSPWELEMSRKFIRLWDPRVSGL